MRAVRLILQQATRVPSASPTRQFVKSGGYEKAIDDFMAANPIHIRSFELPEGVGNLFEFLISRAIMANNDKKHRCLLTLEF